jgi:hypothetical protein
MRVSIAVNAGNIDVKQKLAAMLTVASQYAGHLGMYVNGVLFKDALAQVAEQLRENIKQERG